MIKPHLDYTTIGGAGSHITEQTENYLRIENQMKGIRVLVLPLICQFSVCCNLILCMEQNCTV